MPFRAAAAATPWIALSSVRLLEMVEGSRDRAVVAKR